MRHYIMARKRIITRKWVNVREDKERVEREKYLRRELEKQVSKSDDVWNRIINEVNFITQ